MRSKPSVEKCPTSMRKFILVPAQAIQPCGGSIGWKIGVQKIRLGRTCHATGANYVNDYFYVGR